MISSEDILKPSKNKTIIKAFLKAFLNANFCIKERKDKIFHETRLIDIDIVKKVLQTYNLPMQNIVAGSIVNNSCIK